MDISMSDLKHCPFCGSDAKVRRRYQRQYIYKTFYYVQCTNCRTMTTDFKESSEAVGYWNKRADDFEADDGK